MNAASTSPTSGRHQPVSLYFLPPFSACLTLTSLQGSAPLSVQEGLQTPCPPVLPQSLCPGAYGSLSCSNPIQDRVSHRGPSACLEGSGPTLVLCLDGACPISTSVSKVVCLFPVAQFRTVPKLSRALCPSSSLRL